MPPRAHFELAGSPDIESASNEPGLFATSIHLAILKDVPVKDDTKPRRVGHLDCATDKRNIRGEQIAGSVSPGQREIIVSVIDRGKGLRFPCSQSGSRGQSGQADDRGPVAGLLDQVENQPYCAEFAVSHIEARGVGEEVINGPMLDGP